MVTKIIGILIMMLLIATAFTTIGLNVNDNIKINETLCPLSFDYGICNDDYNWSITEVVSTESTSNSRFPSLDVESDGTVHIAWYDYTNYGGSDNDSDIFYKQRSSDGIWSATEVVSTESTSDSSEPFIAVDNSGTVHVAWFDLTDYGGSGTDEDVFYKQRSSNGSWITTEVVSTESTSKSWYPSLDVDSDGTVHVAWFDDTNYDGSGYDCDIFYKQRSSSGTWTTTEIASISSTGHSSSVLLTAESDGTVHVAWFEYTDYGGSDSDADIFYNQRSNSGTWGTFELVSIQSTNDSFNPSLGIDSDGKVHVVWFDQTDYGGSGSDNDIFYNQRSNSGTWGTTEVASTESSSSSSQPYLDVEADGTVHVAWIDHTNYGGSGTDGDIFYKQRSNNGIWSTAEVVSTESTYQSAFPSLAVETDQTVHVAWEDFTDYLGSGSDCDVFYKYRTSQEPIPSIPILTFEDIKGGLTGISVVLKNIGNETAYDIYWEMNISEGFLYFPRMKNGLLDDPLGPGDETQINIKPMMGFGRGQVFFYCRYTILLNSSRNDLEVEVKQEGQDLGFLLGHVFLPGAQPPKEWVIIDDFEYKEIGTLKLVELKPEYNITNMHNVRVLDSFSSDIMYMGACCFQNGLGILEEGWITKYEVENGLALWEVELLGGE